MLGSVLRLLDTMERMLDSLTERFGESTRTRRRGEPIETIDEIAKRQSGNQGHSFCPSYIASVASVWSASLVGPVRVSRVTVPIAVAGRPAGKQASWQIIASRVVAGWPQDAPRINRW